MQITILIIINFNNTVYCIAQISSAVLLALGG
jgi:hypothetical protein